MKSSLDQSNTDTNKPPKISSSPIKDRIWLAAIFGISISLLLSIGILTGPISYLSSHSDTNFNDLIGLVEKKHVGPDLEEESTTDLFATLSNDSDSQQVDKTNVTIESRELTDDTLSQPPSPTSQINSTQATFLEGESDFASVTNHDFKHNDYINQVDGDDGDDLKKAIVGDDDEHQHRNVAIQYKPTSLVPPASEPQSKNTQLNKEQPPASLVGFSNVTGVTQGQQNVPVTQSFRLTFDTVPDPTTLKSFSFRPEAEFTSTLIGNTLTVYPKRLARNTNYSFGVRYAGFCPFDANTNCTNSDAFSGRYQFGVAFKTDWKEKYTYGYSLLGKPLDAYLFGTNDQSGKSIMLTGGIHGSEWRSGDLTQLVNYLWTRPEELAGQNKSIIIIPYMNPDGTAMGIRYNSRNINLNRNYPTSWVSCSVCGVAPASEPETFYWTTFAINEKVTHLISYHAQWPPDGMIFKGSDYDAATDEFAIWVADRTGYPIGYFPGDSSTPGDGDVPGDQTVWANSVGMKSLIIEATYLGNSDWDMNYRMYLDLIRTY